MDYQAILGFGRASEASESPFSAALTSSDDDLVPELSEIPAGLSGIDMSGVDFDFTSVIGEPFSREYSDELDELASDLGSESDSGCSNAPSPAAASFDYSPAAAAAVTPAHTPSVPNVVIKPSKKALYGAPIDANDARVQALFPEHVLAYEPDEFKRWKKSHGIRRLASAETHRLGHYRRKMLARVYAERARQIRKHRHTDTQHEVQRLQAENAALRQRVAVLERVLNRPHSQTSHRTLQSSSHQRRSPWSI